MQTPSSAVQYFRYRLHEDMVTNYTYLFQYCFNWRPTKAYYINCVTYAGYQTVSVDEATFKSQHCFIIKYDIMMKDSELENMPLVTNFSYCL